MDYLKLLRKPIRTINSDLQLDVSFIQLTLKNFVFRKRQTDYNAKHFWIATV